MRLLTASGTVSSDPDRGEQLCSSGKRQSPAIAGLCVQHNPQTLTHDGQTRRRACPAGESERPVVASAECSNRERAVTSASLAALLLKA